MSISPETIIVIPDTQENYIIYDREITENPDPQFNQNILVTKDNLSNRLYFNMWYTFDDRTLIDKEICIVWENAAQEKGLDICEDKHIDGDRLIFAWDVPVDVTHVAGVVRFSVRITTKDYIWNSLVGHIEVRQGLPYDEVTPAVAPAGWVNYIQDKYSTRLKAMSKADYTALTTKDSNTMYAVTNPDTSVELYLGTTLIMLPISYFDMLKQIIEGTIVNANIPEGITKVKTQLLKNSSTLQSVTIPSTVTEIEDEAFASCTNCTYVDLSNATSLTRIGDRAFYHCYMTTLTLPSSIEYIDTEAFDSCRELVTLTYPETVPNNYSSSSAIFSYCSKLVNVTLPINLTTIALKMFEHCTSLTTITIPDSVTGIGDVAFGGCTALTTINWGASLDIIAERAFEDCTSLVTVHIPAVTTISTRAFNGCSGMTEIRLPDTLTSIGDYAFQNCSALKTVYIGSGITSIYSTAFYQLSSITDIYINLPSTQTQITVPSGKWGATNATIHWTDD